MAMARRLKAMGVGIEQISDATGLDIDEIMQL